MRKCLAFTMVLLLLFCALPVAAAGFRAFLLQKPRVLTVKQRQVLTVWLVGDTRPYLPWVKKCTALYEKSGVSVYLRTASAEELTGENAVLPDVVLFTPFTIQTPVGIFAEVTAPDAVRQSALLCGRYRLCQYALPVALRGYVLSCDPALLGQSRVVQEPPLPGLRTAAPTQAPSAFPMAQLTEASCAPGAPLALLYSFGESLQAVLGAGMPKGTAAAMLPNDQAAGFCTLAPGTGLTDDYLCAALTGSRAESVAYMAALLGRESQQALYDMGFVPVINSPAFTGVCSAFQAETILPNVFEARKDAWQSACKAYQAHLGSLESHLRAFR